MQISATLFYKYGMIFRDVIKSPPIDICRLQEDLQHNRVSLDLWGRTVADIIAASAPGLIHKCPYYVSSFSKSFYSVTEQAIQQGMNVRNASWNLDCIPSVLPTGEYKLIATAKIKGEFVGTVNVMFLVDSPIKNNFG